MNRTRDASDTFNPANEEARSLSSNTRSRGMRLVLLVAVGLGSGLGVTALMVLPEVLKTVLPRTVRRHPVEWSMLGVLAAVSLTRRQVAKGQGGGRIWGRRAIDRLDELSARIWRGGLAVGLGLLALGLFASWAPQYLTWPWNRDVDTFATLAQSWDFGVLPYRDIHGYNFPGHIYLHWILGKSFGWGGTVKYYAVDAALVMLLGIVLVCWSRRRFGETVPGLVIVLGILSIYLGLPYELAGERDWHTALGVVLGLLIADGWPGRRGRAASALAVALALTIRPHAVLFLPAVASAIIEGVRRSGGTWPKAARALAEWTLVFAGFVTLGFAPLVLAGIADDLIRGIRIASYGGPYSAANSRGALAILSDQFQDRMVIASLGSMLLIACLGPHDLKRTARTWTLAMLAALAYRPLHPVTQHMYLVLPLALVSMVALAPGVAWLSLPQALSPTVRLLVVVLILYELVPIPRFCDPDRSLHAIELLARGEAPREPPLGSLQSFPSVAPSTYPWQDYLDVVAYLQGATGPKTRVANLLRCVPWPSLNGPAGRVSPFLAESGICWMWFVRMDLDPEFAQALDRESDAVVVWVPNEDGIEPRMRYPRVVEVVRRQFRPEARFGPIEVWRRVPDHSAEAQSSD